MFDMKKSLLILSLLCFSGIMCAQSEVEEQKDDEIKGAHPYKLEENENGIADTIAHWSIIPHFGFSAFDGDFTSEMKHNVAVPSAGLAVEYNFTPIWNIGIEYMYDMYTVTGNTGHVDTLLTGHMHKAGGYLSMDLINLLFPKAKKKIVSILPYVGGGAAWYKRARYYKDDRWYDAEKRQWIHDTHGKGNTLNYEYDEVNHIKGPDRDKEYKTIGYLQAGVNVEFNLNRTLALGVRANYSYFTRDYVDGRGYHKQSASSYASKNNDGIFDVTLNMRFKLEAVKKSHPRNMVAYDTWEQEQKPIHDTTIIKHDSIIIRETFHETAKEKELEQYYYVYFANAKADIDDKGLITIQQVAERLEEDSTLCAVITGYCDNTGTTGFNYTLGDNRAANVEDELIAEHGIDPSRLCAGGMGKIQGRRSTASYSPNRRASIRLVDKAIFDRLCNNLSDLKANRPTVFDDETPNDNAGASNVKTVPLSQSARHEKVNEYKQRTNEGVMTEKSTTLSKLARKYYDNTYCWVYIYIANKEKISNPNALEPGMELIIPELTEEEMRITKDQSLVLFGNARQQK